jgi:hypothetical protein
MNISTNITQEDYAAFVKHVVESFFQWSLVRGIAITDQHVFVMVDRIAGIILPKRAFSSETERDQFLSELERRSGKMRN